MHASRAIAVAVLLLTYAAPVHAADTVPSVPVDFSPEQRDRPHAAPNPDAIAAIPKSYRFASPGKFTVATTGGGPPLSTYATDASTLVGMEPDTASLIAESLGLQLVLVPTAWADWPLGLASGRYDAVISNVGVTEERKEKFDFTTYRRGLHGIYVPLASPVTRIEKPADAAGLRVIVGVGTNQDRILQRWSREDQAAGLAPLQLLSFDDEAASLLALASKRADVIVQPNASLVFIAGRDRNIRRVGVLSAGWPETSDVGVVTRKGSGLAEPLRIALDRLIHDGTYARALARWQLESEILPASAVNPPGLPKY